MTSSPGPGGPTGALRNSRVLDEASRTRDGTRRVAGALIAALIVGVLHLHMVLRLDETPPLKLHRKVRHATVLLPQ
jgi:hypothetical protein